jgi:hypothetical protein
VHWGEDVAVKHRSPYTRSMMLLITGTKQFAAAIDPEVEFRPTEQLPWGGCYTCFPDGVLQFFSKLLAQIESRRLHDSCECVRNAFHSSRLSYRK